MTGFCSLLRNEILRLSIGFLSAMLISAQSQNMNPEDNPYVNAKLTPSMAVIVIVLIAAMFFMGFFSIYIRHCSTSPSGRGGSFRTVVGVVSGRSRRGRGIDPEAMLALPTFAYSEVKGLKIGKGSLECAVCLNEFESDDENLRLLPKCDHVFHVECIDAWLASHTTCPVCRWNLADQESSEDNTIQVPNSNGLDPEPEVTFSAVDDQQAAVPRSWSMKPSFFSRFPRSHSTGHSLVQPGENTERFTLRLPQEVRKELMDRRLNRASSMVILPRESSSRRGYRGCAGEGSGRAKSYRRIERVEKLDRWSFPSFFSRASSLRSPRVATDGEGTSNPNVLITAVKAPLNCLSRKVHESELARLPV